MEATALGMRPGEQRTGGRHVGLWGNIHRPPMEGGRDRGLDRLHFNATLPFLCEVSNEKWLPKLCEWTATMR